MNTQQKTQIASLRSQDNGYNRIAQTLELSKNTVKSYCKRNNMTKAAIEPAIDIALLKSSFCQECGKEITQTLGRKEKNSALMNAAINGGMPARTKLKEKLFIPILVHTVENHSRRMETAEESTAATPAISQTASRGVMTMSKQEFEAEKNYLLAITIAKSLYVKKDSLPRRNIGKLIQN